MSDRETSVRGNAPDRKWFIQELWERVRPSLLLIMKDLVIAVSLRIGVWVFHLLGAWMPLGGWVDDFLNFIHAAGSIIELFRNKK